MHHTSCFCCHQQNCFKRYQIFFSIDEDERRFVFDEEEYNNTEDCDVRDRDFYEGGYGDFEQILNDYNPLAMDSCEDFPVLYGSENDDDY